MKCVELNFFGMYGIQSQVDKKAHTFLLIYTQVVTNMLMNCYVWYRMYGMAWYGIWYGVWYGIVFDRVWYGMVWDGMAWHGMVRCGMV